MFQLEGMPIELNGTFFLHVQLLSFSVDGLQ